MSENIEGKSAMELLSMGTKAYWLRKYQEAAAYLSKSSEMLVEEHSDAKHNSLGNVYLYYGKSLLELAREDGDPLGDGVPKEVGREDPDADAKKEDGEEGEEAEDGEDETEESGDEEAEGEESAKAKEPTDGEKQEKAADILINGASATSSEFVAEEDADTSQTNDDEDVSEEDAGEGSSGEQKEEDEEPTDLQLAWEVLELGKIIFERRGEQGREDYSDCLVTLGEVSLESENFESAIADIKAGLDIQKEIYTESKDMRKLAQTYYKLGMALTAHNSIDEGVSHYETTMGILRERLKVLEGAGEPGVSDAEEIKDIQMLIPELEEKVQDLKTYKEEAVKNGDDDSVPSSPEKKATNIGHLVKRKRKIEEIIDGEADSSSEVKKLAA